MGQLTLASAAKRAGGDGARSRNVLQRRCACGRHVVAGGECEECRRKKEALQRRARPRPALDGGEPRRTAAAADRLPSGGRPLEPGVADRYRSGLGALTDLVRVHADEAGARVAAAEDAAAVTSGTSIYFARGRYRPDSDAGRELLAHELAHVRQQHRPDGPPAGYRSRPGDRWEREADRDARRAPARWSGRPAAAPASGARQRRTEAEQIASILRTAMRGLGTDEDAIYNALTGRSAAELAAIEQAFAQLSGGESLEDALRSEMSGRELSRALSLLRGESAATETARRLWDAMRGPGTDEEAIFAAVAGRTESQWTEISEAYREMSGETLLDDLRSELNDAEWDRLQTLLPGAEGGAADAEDRATVIANQLEAAIESRVPDRSAIVAALTGRSEAELREIEARFRLLTGDELDARLRERLRHRPRQYQEIRELLHPVDDATRIARRLRRAMQGLGTREDEILAILTGRSADELAAIRTAYQTEYNEALVTRLREELSGGDLAAALALEASGSLDPADELYLAMQGPGTDEERIFAVLAEVQADANPIQAAENLIDSFAAKGYGNLMRELESELTEGELDRALAMFQAWIPSGTCSTDEREEALEAIAGGIARCQNAIGKLNVQIAAGRLSGSVKTALNDTFNPAKSATHPVNVGVAQTVRDRLDSVRTDMLRTASVDCTTANFCSTAQDCGKRYTYGFTAVGVVGGVVQLCPAFFRCLSDYTRPRGLIHEFTHHTGAGGDIYYGTGGFPGLSPLGDGSANDSLENADSYAYFAHEVF